MYNVMFKHLFVANHNYGEEFDKDGTHIAFICRDVFEVVKASKSMFDATFSCWSFSYAGVLWRTLCRRRLF